ncbi:MAG: hypothetical protein ACRDRX_15480 [Pseudonocardiaceae bacterium]
MASLLDYLPRGNTLDDEVWHKRHRFLQWVLGLHLPALFVLGMVLGWGLLVTSTTMAVPTLCLVLGHLIKRRRPASVLITGGLTSCSIILVGFSYGSIEAHFHFFIIIGFIALYQDWVPFLWNILFTVLSHGLGSIWVTNLIFNHLSGQANPWIWSVIHGVAVLFACVGMVIFWRVTEEEQMKRTALTQELADAEVGRRKFTSDLLVNLARRNQSMLYRQLDIINQLEEKQSDPDALGELFRLDHLATRIRRNAESLLVLSGEEAPRIWREPVALIDVVRAAIAETEDLDRVSFSVDERLAVFGHTVTDLTHVLAAERHGIAVSLSPTPGSGVTAVVVLPAELFAEEILDPVPGIPQPRGAASAIQPRGAASAIPPRGGARDRHSLPEQVWTGWWTPTRLPAVQATRWAGTAVYGSPPSAGPATAGQSAASGETGGPQLNRRVPQANLAPELRRGRPVGEVVIAEPALPHSAVTQGDAQRARDALSRYQASRLTALQEQVDADSRSRW